jgi:cytochrome c
MRRVVLGLGVAGMLGGYAMAEVEAISPPIAPLLATADPAAGEAYAKKVCAACHSLNEGGKAIVGPNLYGVVGGPHAHMAGFNYSDALKAKQGPWTYDALFVWLTKPDAYAPGTRMAFPGIKNEKLRLDVIAYLRTLSHNPEPLPEAEAKPPVTDQTATARAAP